MKNKIITIVMLAAMAVLSSGCAGNLTTNIRTTTTPIENIYKVEGKSKEQIYNLARQWFSEYFVSGESVVDYEDKKAGTIIGKGKIPTYKKIISFSPYYDRQLYIGFKLRVDVKDNKIKIRGNFTETITLLKSVGDKATRKLAKTTLSLLKHVRSNNSNSQTNW